MQALPSTRLRMNITSSEYNQNLKIYRQKMAASGVNLAPRSTGVMALNSAMVTRIHGIRPGCSACGK